ncbi:hypothetical protein [Sulfurimonas sp.]|uniref:hypothetical protein n=1 Tax=Sulfurimonas sp. TaxID=2022749 RepID=UPI002B45EDE1|nr:hypothetical protein [Sulfurimonas sp.]
MTYWGSIGGYNSSSLFNPLGVSIAHPSEKGGYNSSSIWYEVRVSIAHPSEKGGYNSSSIWYEVRVSIAHPSEKGGYNKTDEVGEAYVTLVEEKTAINLSGYHRIIDNYSMLHIFDKHGIDAEFR